MLSYHFILLVVVVVVVVVRPSIANRIELDVLSLPSSHWFELASNRSQQKLNRDVLLGLVDGTTSLLPSSIRIRASYEQIHTEQHINLFESNNKPQGMGEEPVLRGYLLTSSFNRSYPFVRVLVASARGSYEDRLIQPICAVITAVNGQDLYETQSCFVFPSSGYCLVTISAMKMVQFGQNNQTKNKMELYLKLHHVASHNDCLSDQTAKQNHIHHETRIGYVDYIDETIAISTLTRSPISIDYPVGIHFPGWHFSVKLKLVLSSTLLPSIIVRCRVPPLLSIHAIQTAIHTLSEYQIIVQHQSRTRYPANAIDFNITITSTTKVRSKEGLEIDLATITFIINSTNQSNNTTPFILSVDWSLLPFDRTILSIPIQVQLDGIQTIVPLTDFTRLINTAMLSRQTQSFPLRIVAINHSGHLQTISQAVCHSENLQLIQVDSSCAHIYFSGHERDDFNHSNGLTSIVVRYEKFLQRIHLIVFIPEYPLRIELTDSKLSRVHGWFVTHRQGETSIERTDEDDDDEDEDEDEKCYPVYQQAFIHVYTKFYRITENGDRIYLFNKLNVVVTPLVHKHLETDNPLVAVVKNGRVIGIGPGKTNIRIYSFPNKFSIGSRTIQVDDEDLVRIKDVSFNFVTGLDFEPKTIEHIDPIYKIQIQLKPIFNRLNIDTPNQFGQLHIVLSYSDNTSIALDQIPAEHYQLNVVLGGSTSSLIRLDRSSSWLNFRVRPLAIGHGYILGRLKMGQQQCTDDANLLQHDLNCEIIISSDDAGHRSNLLLSASSAHQNQAEQYVLLRHAQPPPSRTSPLLIALSILMGACVVLATAFAIRWLMTLHRRRRPSNTELGRDRLSTQSGAEEANQDWIFLDRNSLEMPTKRVTPPPSTLDPILHITSNPLTITTLQRQQELAELSHAQMVAYFDNLKESHA